MKCPHCLKHGKSPCLETRAVEEMIYRRRSCGHCGRTFVTVENVSPTNSIPGTFWRKRTKQPEKKFQNVQLDLFERW